MVGVFCYMFMKNFVFINDELIEEAQAQISIFERGFMFGDAIFETCLVADSKLRFFDDHLRRLSYGLGVLKIKADISKLSFLAKTLIKYNNLSEGTLKISISRGIGSEGYLPTKDCSPLIVMQTNIPSPTPPSITLGISSTICPISYGFKTANSIPYIIAKIEAKENNWFDSVMLSKEGLICETSCANIFWVKKGKIYTPNHDCNIIRGVIRNRIMQLPSFTVFEVRVKLEELFDADEVFITNSRITALAINKIELPTQFTKGLSVNSLNAIIFKNDSTTQKIKQTLII